AERDATPPERAGERVAGGLGQPASLHERRPEAGREQWVADAGPGPEVSPAGHGARAAAWQRTVAVEVVGGRADRLDQIPDRQVGQGRPLPVDHATHLAP